MIYPSIILDSESLIEDLGPYAAALKSNDVSMTDVIDGVLDVVSCVVGTTYDDEDITTVLLDTVWEHISMNAQVEERNLESLNDIEANALEAATIAFATIMHDLEPHHLALVADGSTETIYTLAGFLDGNIVVGVNNVSPYIVNNIY